MAAYTTVISAEASHEIMRFVDIKQKYKPCFPSTFHEHCKGVVLFLQLPRSVTQAQTKLTHPCSLCNTQTLKHRKYYLQIRVSKTNLHSHLHASSKADKGTNRTAAFLPKKQKTSSRKALIEVQSVEATGQDDLKCTCQFLQNFIFNK